MLYILSGSSSPGITVWLGELVKLLQEANKREDALKLEVEHWHQAYLSLHQGCLVFKSVDLRDKCQTMRDHTNRRYYYSMYRLWSR